MASTLSHTLSLVAKPATASPSPGPGNPGSVTSKEWVVPPRPKPGRRPATDTPPSKRKAQNRAAQRAFRERRAARVGELEEQLRQIEDDHDDEVTILKEKMLGLTQELDQCRKELKWWRDRCHSFEKLVASHMGPKGWNAAESFINGGGQGAVSRLTDVNSEEVRSSETERDDVELSHQQGAGEVVMGCSNCSTSHCQCIEDVFNMPNVSELQESSSPRSVTVTLERPRESASIKLEPEEMEIDFTSRFATSQPLAPVSKPLSSPAIDPCGFCTVGTPCICAEMTKQDSRQRVHESFENNRLAPMQNLSQFTPPPSDGDVRSDIILPPINQTTNPCSSEPGTCAQCLTDPRSTLFCKTLAASQSTSTGPSGCCGAKDADSRCCQSRGENASTFNTISTSNAPTRPSLTLSCADTFTTLSRHPNFARASDELALWLPKLQAQPTLLRSERPAMEVEVASVMGVLRYFDRRFANN